MNYASIKPWDIANGPGVRVSLFVSGCTHHCKDCFNPETWDFDYGEPFDEAVEETLLELVGKPYIRGVTYLGGEPFDPDKTVWSFTGYVYGRNLPQVADVTQELLGLLDVLVDGPFIAEKKNLTLRFRGSENQRLIDVPQTLKTGAVVLWDERQ